jgi:hypothetical protein
MGVARGAAVVTGTALRAVGVEIGALVGVGVGVAVGDDVVALAPLMTRCG